MDMKPAAALNVPTTSGFAQQDLESLRQELMRAGLDTWQAGEMITSFLAARGFGVSMPEARTVAGRIESASCSIDCMRHELNQLALPM
ncbi:hypothetical protein [Terriglobus sp.]|uniref:hypothetical protein n=1 Tax=Terriglobus sp. TaxID=1889013 RepID=UPI003B008E20